MTTELLLFKSPSGSKLRAMEMGSGYYFVGRDAAKALGYANPRDAIKKHVDEEDKGVAKRDTKGGVQSIAIISESGLYSLILSSKLPGAKEFKRWVTSEVLPTLRRTGRYSTPAAATPAAKGPRYYWGMNGAYYYAYRVERHRIIFHAKFLTMESAAEFCEVMNAHHSNSQTTSNQLSNSSPQHS